MATRFLFLRFFSFSFRDSHVVQAPLQGVRPSPLSRGVPRERSLGRAVLEQARADQRVERRIGRQSRAAAAAVLRVRAALPPPEDLAAAGEGDDGVDHERMPLREAGRDARH